mmetsp:Transcript_57360/g.158768  ORF Transcript_57360/g.158768 Transcript_57360/m.158768 type:complete len:278 (-) Transcript_57360:614-1447(-)
MPGAAATASLGEGQLAEPGRGCSAPAVCAPSALALQEAQTWRAGNGTARCGWSCRGAHHWTGHGARYAGPQQRDRSEWTAQGVGVAGSLACGGAGSPGRDGVGPHPGRARTKSTARRGGQPRRVAAPPAACLAGDAGLPRRQAPEPHPGHRDPAAPPGPERGAALRDGLGEDAGLPASSARAGTRCRPGTSGRPRRRRRGARPDPRAGRADHGGGGEPLPRGPRAGRARGAGLLGHDLGRHADRRNAERAAGGVRQAGRRRREAPARPGGGVRARRV